MPALGSILVVGNAVLDVLLGVDHTPSEDEEMRAEWRRLDLGGNGANTARVLAALGHRVALLATVAPDEEAELLRRLLHESGVEVGRLVTAAAGHTPVSYIMLDQASGARTIVHHRDLAEVAFEDFRASSPLHYEWVHFEGRNISEVTRMMKHLRAGDFRGGVSLEIEKPRHDIEALLPLVDLAFFSRPYAEARGYRSAPELLGAVRLPEASRATMTCTWGAAGAWVVEPAGEVLHCPAFVPERVVDTVGAGDVFNAAMIDGFTRHRGAVESLRLATRLAGKKVGQHGFEGL